MSRTYGVRLTYEEIMLLDGKCSEEVQKEVDRAKGEAAIGLDDFCNEIIQHAVETGVLEVHRVNICKCEHCSTKPGGYNKYLRSGRYHRKGDDNYDSPIRYTGVSFHAFQFFTGLPGCCWDCWKEKYEEKVLRYIADHDLPVQVYDNQYTRNKYRIDKQVTCPKCKETMYLSEMKPHTWYGWICPKCGEHVQPYCTNKHRMVKW